MRITHRQRSHHRFGAKAPRVSISQAEITADLIYPATPRRGEARLADGARRR